MDESTLEMAEALTEKLNQAGVAACSRGAIPALDLDPWQYLRTDCEVCGEALTTFRMQKGLEICVECKQVAESTARRRR